MRPSKFDVMADELARRFRQEGWAPGAPLPSQQRLAADFGVSRSSVQKALAALGARGLVETRPGKGSFVGGGKNAPAGRMATIAYAFPREMRLNVDAEDNYGVEVLWGIEEEATALGIRLSLRSYEPDKELLDVEAFITALEADGLILHSDFPAQDEPRALHAGTPVVIAGRPAATTGIGAVSPNFYDAFIDCCRLLEQAGYSSVGGLFSGAHGWGGDIRAALENAGRSCKRLRVQAIDFTAKQDNYHYLMDDRLVGETLSDLAECGPLPQALLCNSDWTARSAIRALQRLGLAVPRDVGVIGCLGLRLGGITAPKLSTLGLDSKEIGRRAVRMLRAMAASPLAAATERVPLRLIERDTFTLERNPLHAR